MRIPGGRLKLSQLRNHVSQMEKCFENGAQPDVNPYPDSWSTSQIRDANKDILNRTAKEGSAIYTGDPTLAEVAGNKTKLAKFSDNAARVAGGLLLGGLVASGVAIFGLASPALLLVGAVGLGGGLLASEVAGKSSKFETTTDNLEMWGKALTSKEEPKAKKSGPQSFIPKGTLLDQKWELSPANRVTQE